MNTDSTGHPMQSLLTVRNLRVHYETPEGPVMAVERANIDIYRGEILGLVGESGCGKTTIAMACLRLVPPPGRIVDGQVLLDGTDILGLSKRALRDFRWRKLALIPQGAMNSLNPIMRVSDQMADVINTHERGHSRHRLKERILDLLGTVGLPPHTSRLYPHELSGGMKQRVCIAMAIALNPPLIIADEPTSALDVVIQRVVAETILKVKTQLGVSMIMIGHDMGLMAQMADRIAVMYAGHVVEIGPVADIFARPLHPYTKLLIDSIPSIDRPKPLTVTSGLTHDLRRPPPGCIFQFRCPDVTNRCRTQIPSMQAVRPGHETACHLYE